MIMVFFIIILGLDFVFQRNSKKK